ncbi:MAG: MoxR family ATPase [Bacteroidota bacterium]
MSQAFDPNNPQKYLVDPGLEAALEVALDLGMPLLVTGEPGTGKTQLAHYIARKLDCSLQEFYTKTTAKARDLFYKYNALTHFRDTQHKSEGVKSMSYISFECLGQAILDSPHKRSVVLIDEIDKAPRDFPNDVLFEFAQLAFKVQEAGADEARAWAKSNDFALQPDEQGYFRFNPETGQRPILILTSNSEKNLPDAFLRRCVYYHIPFPSRERLAEIVSQNLSLSDTFQRHMLAHAVNYFVDIRQEHGLRKKPATAELLAWIHILHKKELDLSESINEIEARRLIEQELASTLSVLTKNREDRDRILESLKH